MNKQTAGTSSKKASFSTSGTSVTSGADTIADSVQDLVDQGAETIDAIRSRVADVTDDAKVKGVELVDRTTRLVKQHPLASLAVAFGAGYVAMRITTSKITSLAMLAGLVYTGGRLMRS